MTPFWLLRGPGAAHRDDGSDNKHYETDDDCDGFHWESVCLCVALVKLGSVQFPPERPLDPVSSQRVTFGTVCVRTGAGRYCH